MPQTTSNVFTLKDIFRIPMQAVIEANASAAETAISFIRKYGFKPIDGAGPDNWGELRFISFTYEYTQNGILKTMTIVIPLLSLIPIPLLEIKEAVFDFGIKIIDYSKTITGDSKNKSQLTGPAPDPATVSAMIVPVNKNQNTTVSEKQPSMTANLNVHVEMIKADLPAGILQLMNLGQQATQGLLEDLYTLKADKDSIFFNEKNLEQELTITVERTNGNPPENRKIITTEIKRNVAFSENILAEPPIILKGDVVGQPTVVAVKALCDAKGIVLLSLKCKSKEHLEGNNGFIKISVQGADDILVYYRYD